MLLYKRNASNLSTKGLFSFSTIRVVYVGGDDDDDDNSDKVIKLYRFIHEKNHDRRLHKAHVELRVSTKMQNLKGGKGKNVFFYQRESCGRM